MVSSITHQAAHVPYQLYLYVYSTCWMHFERIENTKKNRIEEEEEEELTHKRNEEKQKIVRTYSR